MFKVIDICKTKGEYNLYICGRRIKDHTFRTESGAHKWLDDNNNTGIITKIVNRHIKNLIQVHIILPALYFIMALIFKWNLTVVCILALITSIFSIIAELVLCDMEPLAKALTPIHKKKVKGLDLLVDIRRNNLVYKPTYKVLFNLYKMNVFYCIALLIVTIVLFMR